MWILDRKQDLLAARRIQVGVDGPDGAIVGNDAKRGIEGIDELHKGQWLGVLTPARCPCLSILGNTLKHIQC